jgi:hypothetical protein
MPSQPGRGFAKGLLLGLSLSVVVLGASCKDDRVDGIIAFLGNNQGPPNTWTGLAGIEKQNAIDLRRTLDDLSCRVWKLENPGQPTPTPCPPGGPGTIPKDPPNYP